MRPISTARMSPPRGSVSESTRTKPLLWKTSAPNSETAIRDGQWKLHHPTKKRGEVELYDLSSDPSERNNLAAEKPDVVKTLPLADRLREAARPPARIRDGYQRLDERPLLVRQIRPRRLPRRFQFIRHGLALRCSITA